MSLNSRGVDDAESVHGGRGNRGAIVTASWTLLSAGQLPLAPVGTHGQTVTPVYEGWYPNPDGTISVSWGYFNRNSEEIVRVPVGADNRIEPGGPDQGQPTVFLPRRHRGVFTVVVPGDFGDDEVLWTLTFRGDSQTIPGHLHRDWLLDALGGNTRGDLRVFANDRSGGGSQCCWTNAFVRVNVS